MALKLNPTILLGAIGLAMIGLVSGLLWATFLLSAPEVKKPNQSQLTPPKTVVIAGDIACEAGDAKNVFICRDADTAGLVLSLKPDAVLTAGDNQYPKGSLKSYQEGYDKTWGQFKDITYPTPGNHEYLTPGAGGYFDYFGKQAGERGKGYYAFSVGAWRLIALNSEVDVSKSSPQVTWLKQELETNKTACTLAYWHKPRFSTGSHESDPSFDTLWRTLYNYDVDIVVNGHSHNYERFVPQNPDGAYDPQKGITQFVSGMGGRSPGLFTSSLRTLVTRQNHAFGVLKFSLYPRAAKYEFVPADSIQLYSDSGTITCH